VTAEEDLQAAWIPVYGYIEIGMSIDPNLRKFLKMIGSRFVRSHLGNILNIDVETPIFYPDMNFAHHVIGEIDKVCGTRPTMRSTTSTRVSQSMFPCPKPSLKSAPMYGTRLPRWMHGRRHIAWRPTLPGERAHRHHGAEYFLPEDFGRPSADD
jgi:hypothetical protein